MEDVPQQHQDRTADPLNLPTNTGAGGGSGGNDVPIAARVGGRKIVESIMSATTNFLRPDPVPQPFNQARLYVSFSPNLQFVHRRTLQECVRRLREQGVTSVWLDYEQGVVDRLECRDYRLRAADACDAFLAFVDRDYVTNRQMHTELRAAALRKQTQSSPLILAILLDEGVSTETLVAQCGTESRPTFDAVCKLKSAAHAIHERAHEFLVACGAQLEELATFGSLETADDRLSPSNSYTAKRITDWSVFDVQCWLQHMGIKEIYLHRFAEWQVDGVLLVSLSESDLAEHLLIDNVAIRRKLIKTVCSILEADAHLPINWHTRLQRNKQKQDSVFIVTDPSSALDAKLSDAIRTELSKAGFATYQRVDVAQRDHVIAPAIAASSRLLLLLTPVSARNRAVINDLMLADYCDKLTPTHTCVCAFKRSALCALPLGLQAALHDATAIDFESAPSVPCKQSLLFWLQPTNTVNGVVFDQPFVDRMRAGLQPFSSLLQFSYATGQSPSDSASSPASQSQSQPQSHSQSQSQSNASPTYTHASLSVQQPLTRMMSTMSGKHTVYFSYASDLHGRMQNLHSILEANNFTSYLASTCVPATDEVAEVATQTANLNEVRRANNVQALQNCQTLVLCVTPPYLVSAVCVHDVLLAEQFAKPIIPVLFAATQWPPVNSRLKKALAGNKLVDFSSDKLFVRHMPYFLERIRTVVQVNTFNQ